MPIPLPNLDNHTFADLTTEARELIPVLYPAWTDHNPSDPGIVLVELLAWLTEMLLYSLNQIPEANTRKFLQLLGGAAPTEGGLDAAVFQTMGDLRERYRAVTAEDYEYLVREIWRDSPEAAGLPKVRRARCVPGWDLTADPAAPTPAHVSVVVVPETVVPETGEVDPRLTTALFQFLDSRRILTTRHHVVGPSYVDVGIAANLALHEDSPPDDALNDAHSRLVVFFDPLYGGAVGDGWPFGQNVYASEIYAVLEQSDFLDYVEDLKLTGQVPILDAGGQVIGIELDAHQLVRLARLDLVGYDSYGRTHPRSWNGAS